jgi:hypothetical protein
MLLEARLVHAEPGRRVVEVRAREGSLELGSSLGEAATAEEAEDRARRRLLARLGTAVAPTAAASPPESAPASPQGPPPESAPGSAAAETSASTAETPAQEPEAPPPEPGEPAADPEDWSGELAQLELALQRLGWGRDQEGIYLQRAFGHPSRARITTYADLTAYLRALEQLAPGSDPAAADVPLRRRDLLHQCDELLERLGWDPQQGRSFLRSRLGAESRRQLSDPDLLRFNMLLEEALLDS